MSGIELLDGVVLAVLDPGSRVWEIATKWSPVNLLVESLKDNKIIFSHQKAHQRW
jgi:hypothetical protein